MKVKQIKRIIGLCLVCLLLGTDVLRVSAAESLSFPGQEEIQQDAQQGEEIAQQEIQQSEDKEITEIAETDESEEELYGQAIAVRAAASSNEWLDGDYAYISAAGMVKDAESSTEYSIRTGTEPWDSASEADEAGNDATPLDAKVRSFDLVSYTTWFQTKMRDGAPYAHYRTGTLHFEFILPGTSSEVQFETGSMGWLSAKKEANYTITEGEYQGKPCQILRGSCLLEPNEQNENAIGESYQELSVVIRVLAMRNEEVVQPLFTYWLDGCQVQASSEDIVTGSGVECSEHQEQEYKTITPPEIIVTAAPRYNIQLKTCDERAQYVGSFDFSTGNEYAMNKDAGNVYGRLHVIGITVQLVGKPDQGLRGCELPDENTLTFEINLTSQFSGENGEAHNTTDSYTPLIWSMEGNDKNDHKKQQYDERAITGSYKFAAGGAPFNSDNYLYYTCADGGIWTGSQTGNTVSVKVSGYNIDLTQLPYTDSNCNQKNYVYYNPDTINKFWEVQTACFSAGELWVVQPFYNQDEEYVVDEYGTGTFTLTAIDNALYTIGQNGIENPQTQAKDDDDFCAFSMELEKPGNINHSVNYQKYGETADNTPLTDGCYKNGKDWIVAGGQLNIQGMLKHNTAEGLNTGVAYDELIKFDDAFFVLEGIQAGSSAGLSNMTQQFLYGAKPDQNGWDHHGLEPDQDGYDAEMMNATADDLIFFSSLKELQNAGYVCTAVLWEARGVASSQSTNCYFSLQGHVADTAKVNAVYMVTHSAQAWNKQDVQQAAAEYLDKDAMALTDDDYIRYMQEAFPSRAQGEKLSYESDYPDAFWKADTENNGGLATYEKAKYNEDGCYAEGTAGVTDGDSCLVVAFTTKIRKAVMQTSTSGAEKLAYDMDVNQRVADYALYLSAQRTAGESITEGAEMVTDLYVEDILPKGLTYLKGSAVLGGTYQQTIEGQQGNILGGTAMEPEITENADGTTLLRWTIKDVTVTEHETTTFQPIYYSCRIGTPEDASTDVHNNDQLSNTAIVWASKEQKRDFSAANENQSVLGIQVSKNNAVSISKTTKTPLVEAGESMLFTLNVGNNAANEMEVIALDGLPYNGDGRGTFFSGACQVTEITVKNLDLLNGIELYYSDSESDREKVSANYAKADFENGNWKKLSVNSTDGTVTLPQNFTPVAIAAVGKLPAQETLKIDLTMLLPDGKAGDRAVNSLSCDKLETETGSSVVQRVLEGVVWLDKDRDGIRTEEEKHVDGVKITLMKLKDGGNPSDMNDYEPYVLADGSKAEIESGQQMNLSDGIVTSYENGRYQFSGLPEGTFGVLFTDGTFDLYGYQASPQDVGEDDTIDSDAAPFYEREELKLAWIGEINMPPKEEMKTPEYRSAYHDLGIYVPETVPDTGILQSFDRSLPIWSLAGVLFLTGVVSAKRRRRVR